MADRPISDEGGDIAASVVAAVLRDAGDAAYGRLVVTGPTPSAARPALYSVAPAQLISRPVKHADDARAALAGLWLWFDALDECHQIAQQIASPTGSFWHAIMHRREGDFSNAKYWYHRCDGHHVLKLMGAVASSLAGEFSSDRTVARALVGGWNADGFVDLVAAVHDKPSDPRHELAVRLQRLEWKGLFDYCLREAVEADRADIDAWDERVAGRGT